MGEQSIEADVVIVGAGPNGAIVADRTVQAGLKTVLLDRKPKNQVGAQWINDVPLWMLKKAGLLEVCTQPHSLDLGRFILLSPSETSRVVTESCPFAEVHMGELGKYLNGQVEKSSLSLALYNTEVNAVDIHTSGRPICLSAYSKVKDITYKIRAKLYIDASGLSGALRKRVPVLAGMCEAPTRLDLCTAAQEVRSVEDKEGVLQFLEEHQAEPGDVLAFASAQGGYSVLRVKVAKNLSTILFLSGVRAVSKQLSPISMIEDFTLERLWIGAKLSGGFRSIPLRRPYSALVAEGVALVGDSACQVYPSHGSGVGVGLLAARMLGDTIAKASVKNEDIGGIQQLWGYPLRFHRELGGVLATSDIFRRYIQEFATEEAEELIGSGWISSSILQDVLGQKIPRVYWKDLKSQLTKGFWKGPSLGELVKIVAKSFLVRGVAKTYPQKPGKNWKNLLHYERRMARLVDKI